MGNSLAPPPGGMVGSRSLVGTQMFNIGRLRNQFVQVVPVGFVSITGLGPGGDSNKSGKTMFLTTIAATNGDPQWPIGKSQGAAIADLLFNPTKMGDDRARGTGTPARYGYVVNVYAHTDEPADHADPITVWTRINNQAPYVTARIARGVVVARGSDDDARHDHADELWNNHEWEGLSDGRPDIGGGRYVDVLFGGTTRTIAYVAHRANLTIPPSLLSHGLKSGQSPADIGSVLIEQAGLRHLFEAEREARAAYYQARADLSDAADEHERASLAEQTELDAIGQRRTAHELLMRAEQAWALHYARGLVEAHDERTRLTSEIADLTEKRAPVASLLDRQQHELEELGDVEQLERVHIESARIASEAASRLERAIAATAEAETASRQARARLIELRDAADNTRLSVAEATDADRDARAALVGARATEERVAAELRDAEGALERARTGLAGTAGEAAETLLVAGIDAAVLADSTVVADRGRWEAALDPWRAAVIVDAEDAQRAVELLADHPGIVVLAGSPGTSTRPEGIATADARALQFLAALDRATSATVGPSRVSYRDFGATVIGGFEEPTLGRAQIVQTAERSVAEARTRHARAEGRAASAEIVAQEAEQDLARARAAEAAAKLERGLFGLDEAVGVARKKEARARSESEDATAKAESARDRWRNLEVRREAVQARIERTQGQLDQLDEARGALARDHDNIRLDYWAEGWGESVESARTAVAESRLDRDTLSADARESLAAALARLNIDTAAPESAPTASLREAIRQRMAPETSGQSHGRGFRTMADALADYLEQMRRGDDQRATRISRDRASRARRIQSLRDTASGLLDGARATQEMTDGQVRARLVKVSRAFHDLTIGSNVGPTAELRVETTRPAMPDLDAAVAESDRAVEWTWHVTPAWTSAPDGSAVPYHVMQPNEAQAKLQAANLMLASLLADDASAGKLLVLDELSAHLGSQNRRRILRALRDTARATGVTVLATCQDDLLPQAAEVSHQTIEFRLLSDSDELNQLTRVTGVDPTDARVQLIADLVTDARPVA